MNRSSDTRRPRQKRFWHRIQGQLILVLLILLIPTLLIQAYVFNERYKTRRQTELQANLEIARGVALSFETFVEDVLHQELSIGLALTSKTLAEEDTNWILERSKAGNPAIWELFWAKADGIVTAATGPQFVGMNLADRPYFQEIISGRDWAVSNLLLSRTTNRPGFTIARGIRSDAGELLGIIVAGILPEKLDHVLAIERSKGGGHALVDTKGMMVYRYPSINPTWEQRNWLRDYPEFKEVLSGKEIAKTVFAPYEGKNRLVGFTPVLKIGWAATAGRTEEIALQPVISQLVPQAVLLFVITIVGFVAAIICSRFIGSSVRRLRDHALALGSGDLQNPVVASGPAELKELADSFNQMVENLRSREISLQQQRECMGVTLNSIGDAVIATDTAGNVTFLNPVAAALTGWQTEEAAGRPIENIFRIINEQTREPADDIVGRVLRDGYTISLANHTALVTRDGKEIPIENSAAPIRDGQGNVSGVVLVFHDVTERQRAREALHESEERLRLLGDNLPESALYQYTHENDDSVRFLYISAGVERLNGVSAQDVLSDAGTIHRQIPPEHFQRLVEAELRSSREMSDFDMEIPMHRPDGEVRWMRLHSRPRRLSDGRTIWDGVQIDVTERKKAEDALRESEERFRVAQELSPDGFTILRPVRDPQGRVVDFTWVYANATAERFVGMTLPSLVDRSLLELFPGHYDSPLLRAYHQAAETGQPCVQEALYHGDGILAQRWFRVAVVSMGRDIAILSQDITERKQAEMDLERMRNILSEGEKIAHMGSFEYIADTQMTVWSEEEYRIYGLDPAGPSPTYNVMLTKCIHPEDAALLHQTFVAALENSAIYELEHRIVHPDGTVRWVHDRAYPYLDEDGKLIRYIGATLDITERKKAEEALRLTQVSIDDSAEMVAWFTPDGKVRYANDATCRTLGYSRDELMTLTALDFSPGFTWEQYSEHWQEVRQRKSFSLEVTHRRKDGSEYPAEVLVNHIEHGGQEYIFAYGRDITERKRAEEALRQGEQRLIRVLESMPDAFISFDSDMRYTYVNANAECLQAACREELIGKDVRGIYPDADSYKTISQYERVIREQKPVTSTSYHAGFDRWVEIRAFPTPDGISVFYKDVSAQVKAEEALRRAYDELELRVKERTAELEEVNERLNLEIEERQRALVSVRAERQRLYDVLETLPVYICLLKPDYHVSFVNRVFRDSFGESEEGLRCHEFLFGRNEPCEICETFKVLEDMRPRQWEWTGPNHRVYSVFDFPFTDTDGSTRILEMGIDITERKKAGAKLKETMAKLEESNQALKDFVSIASHDLKEPLRKVATFGNMLRQRSQDSLGKTENDYLNRMIDATQRMQTLLTSLLEYSRAATGHESLQEIDLYDLVHEVLSDLEVRIANTGGEVRVGKLPSITADPTQMRQLFQNFIGNALKFHKSDEKPIVKVFCTPTDKRVCQIVIEDNGIGFDQEFADKIFAPFQRLHGKSSQYEGTGMGLAICKKIIERHGGTITARSTPGIGSSFIIQFPISEIVNS